MKTVVLDDDPTGTQSAADVDVLLDWDWQLIRDALRASDALYLQTNSRALPEERAVQLAQRIQGELRRVEADLGAPIAVVLRGDSTLRGHVFPESDVFAGRTAPILFVPAFPAGGRVTVDSVHYVTEAGQRVPAGQTEYAKDPVFGYRSSNLVDYVAEKGRRNGVSVPLALVRQTQGQAVADAIRAAGGDDVILPDVETDDDVQLVAHAARSVQEAGTDLVVRGGAPIAAALSGKSSRGYLSTPLPDTAKAVLVVCGSHTTGATRQLERLTRATGWEPVVIRTDHAYDDPEQEAATAATQAIERLGSSAGVIICSERTRRERDDTLEHGARVMHALTSATRAIAPRVDTVISKGGITSADVALVGLAAKGARVRGQIFAGVSVWDLRTELRPRVLVVVPGNVGAEDALIDAVKVVKEVTHA